MKTGRIAKLLLVLLVLITILPVTSSRAQTTITDMKRQEMLNIANAYANHTWIASDFNVRHDALVDTPNREFYSQWSAAIGWLMGQNTGVPYQWGGWSALSDNALRLRPDTDGLFFEEQINSIHRKAAGDISTIGGEIPTAAGVDCSGLISRAWQTRTKFGTGSRAAMDGLFGISRPIRFADLRPGDILNAAGHVIMFESFLTVEKDSPGVTQFRAIEASGKDWKVSARNYTLVNKTQVNETWRGTSYVTDQVTISSGGTNYPSYWPRTYLTPLDIVLVLDRSGSMGSTYMQSAKTSAKYFVDMMRNGDKVSVVDFDQRSTVTYPLTEITDTGAQKEAAKSAIDSLYARGNTSIGGGLKAALDQLTTLGANDPVRMIILLTDGQENSSPMAATILPSLIQQRVTVHTIGLGSGSQQPLLQSIAQQTGGIFKYSPTSADLWTVYNGISAQVYGTSVVRTINGTVGEGQTVQHQVLVDSSMGSVTFSLNWPGSTLDLHPVQPDGTLLDLADPRVTHVKGPTYELFTIDAPQSGAWGLNVYGADTRSAAEPFTISVSGFNAMNMVVSAKPQMVKNQPLWITAHITDSYLDVEAPQYVLGAVMQATITLPNNAKHSMALYDDGSHNDGMASDGLYGGAFHEVFLLGTYNIDVKAEGLNARAGEPFTREASISIRVIDRLKFYLPVIRRQR